MVRAGVRALDRIGTISEEDGSDSRCWRRARDHRRTGDTRYDRSPSAPRAWIARASHSRDSRQHSRHVSPSSLDRRGRRMRRTLARLRGPAAPAPDARRARSPEPNPITGWHRRALAPPEAARPVRCRSSSMRSRDGDRRRSRRILRRPLLVGDTAFVGGGFHRAGLHSVLEPRCSACDLIRPALGHESRRGAVARSGRSGRAAADARHPCTRSGSVHHDPAARRARKGAKKNGRQRDAGLRRTAALVWGLVES